MTTAQADHTFEDTMPDFERLSRNMGQLIEETGRVTAAYLKPYESGKVSDGFADEITDVMKTLGQVAERWMTDPSKSFEAQSRITSAFFDLWDSTLKRMTGESAAPVASPGPRDTRFTDPEWSTNPVFDFLKQAYLITSQWAEQLVEGADGLDDHTRHKARFYLKQVSSALSPSNFLATNPEVLRDTFRQNGENLVRGMRMLAEDIDAGDGELRLRQSDPGAFTIGVDVANTPGKVVFRNRLIELIQYAPMTESVLARPVLLVSPWINKFYILDINPQKSFIRWAVTQGLTVFCVSWVNPDERHAEMGFEEYIHEGLFAAIDAINTACGTQSIAAVGYCVGGTLLSIAASLMAQRGDTRIDSLTLLTTQVEFTHAGDLKTFIDEPQVLSIEAEMRSKGYLGSARMANTFNMLRPNDLIWPYMVNVYLKGNSPLPFDLLYWNADSTRMAAANHSFYLRSCYLENQIAQKNMQIDGMTVDLEQVAIPLYMLATREDHIAPARSVFLGAQCFGSPITFVLAGSGHIAGVINPPSKSKYGFLTGNKVAGSLESWIETAVEEPGSWWPHWFSWLESQAPERTAAREPGSGALKALCDAPGTYVMAKG